MKNSEDSLDAILWSLVRAMRVRAMVIFEAGRPYLARFRLQDPAALGLTQERERTPFRTYLHYLFASDDVGYFHDHPWDESQSLILTGRYAEERVDASGRVTMREFGPGDVNVIRSDDVHRIDPLTPGVWTMFTAGNRHEASWGFYPRGTGRDAKIPWRERNFAVKGDEGAIHMVSNDERLEAWRQEAARRA